MTGETSSGEAVSLLQELGLQEYEARCFLALTQLTSGTAKDVHELSDVPRTRVYDAIRVLESQGLVEVQHSSPQRYRAVDVDEATRTLHRKYDDRIDTLESYLETVDRRERDADADPIQEVWALSGQAAIDSRTLDLLADAESEIALVVVDDRLLSEGLYDALHAAVERDLAIILGGQTEAITDRLGTELPQTRVFETGLDFLTARDADHEVGISRILLVDRETLLIGSYYPGADDPTEQAIFATGLDNGMVVLLRRLISTGLARVEDPTA